MRPAAIFDFDGTLFDGHVWEGIVRHHRTQRVNRRWLYVYLGVHLGLWGLYKLGLFDESRARRFWAQDMAWAIRGLSEEEAHRAFEWIVAEHVQPTWRPDVLERLRWHQEQGHRVMLLSGSFEPLLDLVARDLGVEVALGARLEMRNGRYTGRVIPPLPMGTGKVERLKLYLDSEGRDVDLKASFAYGDSYTDVPLLETVGHPVAVYPDPDLAAVACQRGWPILGAPQER